MARSAPAALIVELLAWIDARPRTYRETMDAWRTSCPRMPVWEDATSDGLVEVVPRDPPDLEHSLVRLTRSGRETLAAANGGSDDASRQRDSETISGRSRT